ncbi:MAG: HAMP domain-containing histidine kinase, partial [Eubacterium sp.]|nr:HAMP domain-containing histidine kinase [Eubacterium sp.]
MSVKEVLKGQYLKNNIFAKYFILFATIFLVVMTILGTTLTILVNVYTTNENTKLLKENTLSMANTVSSSLSVGDINNDFSLEKLMICNSLNVISNSIDADLVVCDVEGNIILCKEKANASPFYDELHRCEYHSEFTVGNSLLKSVYEGGYVGTGSVNGKRSYIASYPIYSNNQIIGLVLATTDANVNTLTLAVLRMFFVSALACLAIAFICIWLLTRRFVRPLRQMSVAAKKFAIGDFSYRVKVSGEDELSELGRAFNDMADALDSLESSRRSFVSNVSHELRTPMTSIGGFIDGILDGTIPKEKTSYYLNIVSGEIRRLSRLVVAMLNMSKIESGSFEMKASNYDISNQIIHILLTFEQKIDEKKIEIQGLENLHPTYIVADADMIYQ